MTESNRVAWIFLMSSVVRFRAASRAASASSTHRTRMLSSRICTSSRGMDILVSSPSPSPSNTVVFWEITTLPEPGEVFKKPCWHSS